MLGQTHVKMPEIGRSYCSRNKPWEFQWIFFSILIDFWGVLPTQEARLKDVPWNRATHWPTFVAQEYPQQVFKNGLPIWALSWHQQCDANAHWTYDDVHCCPKQEPVGTNGGLSENGHPQAIEMGTNGFRGALFSKPTMWTNMWDLSSDRHFVWACLKIEVNLGLSLNGDALKMVLLI